MTTPHARVLAAAEQTARNRKQDNPTDNTLRKYGLTRQDFNMLLDAQGGVCAICKLKPSGRWNIDHYHARGWKKRKPEVRKIFVRGVLCWHCNRYYIGRGMTLERARNVVEYLRNYESRVLGKNYTNPDAVLYIGGIPITDTTAKKKAGQW